MQVNNAGVSGTVITDKDLASVLISNPGVSGFCYGIENSYNRFE